MRTTVTEHAFSRCSVNPCTYFQTNSCGLKILSRLLFLIWFYIRIIIKFVFGNLGLFSSENLVYADTRFKLICINLGFTFYYIMVSCTFTHPCSTCFPTPSLSQANSIILPLFDNYEVNRNHMIT